jgi:hypothetical protein
MPGFGSHMQGTVAVIAAKAMSDQMHIKAAKARAALECGREMRFISYDFSNEGQ